MRENSPGDADFTPSALTTLTTLVFINLIRALSGQGWRSGVRPDVAYFPHAAYVKVNKK